MGADLKSRLLEFIDYKGLTVQSFESQVKISNGAVSKMGDGTRKSTLKKISIPFPELNINWVLTGEGNMLKTETSCSKTETIPNGLTPKNGSDYRLVPLVHIDSVGGVHSGNEVSVEENQYVDKYIPFVNAQEGDIAIFQTGTSMIPTVPPGSILQIRKVERWREYLGFGNIFVLELKDGRRITKEINRYDQNPKEFVWCHSHNPEVADEELPKDMIVSVWKVIKILTDKGW